MTPELLFAEVCGASGLRSDFGGAVLSPGRHSRGHSLAVTARNCLCLEAAAELAQGKGFKVPSNPNWES